MVKQMTSGANTLWSLSELLQKLNLVMGEFAIRLAKRSPGPEQRAPVSH